jgi:hypothetical protein
MNERPRPQGAAFLISIASFSIFPLAATGASQVVVQDDVAYITQVD